MYGYVKLYRKKTMYNYVKLLIENCTVCPSEAAMLCLSGSNQTYGERIEAEIQPLIIYFVLVGVVTLVSAYTALSLWMWAGERQITNIRKRFFRGVMRQDIGWFDTHEVGELNSRFSE